MTSNKSSIVSILLCLLSIPIITTLGSIDGPSSGNTPIRLTTNKKEQLQQKPITTPHLWKLQDPSSMDGTPSTNVNNQNNPQQPPPTGTSNIQKLAAKVEILEPPNQSYIAGKHFNVKLKINFHPHHQERFKKEYQESDNSGYVCLSLDNGLYNCWKILNQSNIVFANVSNGNHTLVATLYKDGVVQNETTSEEIMFTMVHDPIFEDEEGRNEFHSMLPSNINDNIMEEEEDHEGVEVSYPVVQVLNPLHRVSYSTYDLEVTTKLAPTSQPETFEKYFQHGFICYDVDFATGQACYSIFYHNFNPLILGLNIGMHTIQASLIHPQTGDILPDSSMGRITFFIAGKDNAGATFVADINIHGKLHKVPLMNGGSIVAQARYLCSIIGYSGNIDDCIEPIGMHLTNIAHQQKLSID